MSEPVIQVEGFNRDNVKEFAPIIKEFFSSYSEKPAEESFEEWLEKELGNHLTDKSDSDIRSLTTEIINGVDSFNSNLQSLNSAIDSGITKEAWLVEQLRIVADKNNVAIDTFGTHLEQINQALTENNRSIIEALNSNGGIIKVNFDEPVKVERVDNIQWNELKTSALAVSIAKQASLNSVGSTALSTGLNLALDSDENVAISKAEFISRALLSDKDDEIKKTASAALSVAVNRGIFPSVSKNITGKTIANVSSLGIENTKILYSLGSGNISALQAIDLTARNYMALVSGMSCEKIGAGIGASLFSFIPVIGTTVGGVVGGLVGRIVGNKITQTVKKGISKVVSVAVSVAKSTWRAVSSTVKSVGRGIRSVGRAIASFFGF